MKLSTVFFIAVVVIVGMGVEASLLNRAIADMPPLKPSVCYYYSEGNPVIVPTTKMKQLSDNHYYAIVGSTWLDADFALTPPEQYDIRFLKVDDEGNTRGPDGRTYSVLSGSGGNFDKFVVVFADTSDGFLDVDCH